MSERKKYRSHIEDIEPKNSFNVPDGYFENFSSRLQYKIQQEKSPQHVKSKISGISGFNLAMAASFIGLMVITYSGIRYLTGNQNRANTGTIEINDLITYHVNDLDDNLIYDFLEETSLEESDLETVTDERILNEMIDYIVTSNIDLNLLVQEL